MVDCDADIVNVERLQSSHVLHGVVHVAGIALGHFKLDWLDPTQIYVIELHVE